MNKILKPDFFDRNSVVVAKDLIGKYLVREQGGKTIASKIVEVEAYEGLLDKASHAHRGQTTRNTPMFSDPGTIYVYFTYGMHWMLNISCGKKGHPAAVLIRGLEDCIGPARITKKLGIDKMLSGKMLGKKSGLWIEERKAENKLKIKRTPRIGINSAGPIWTKKLYRFVLDKK
jgi:DNA-3-methyladenine glycosylase